MKRNEKTRFVIARLVILIVSAAALVFILSSCGNKQPSGADATTETESQTTATTPSVLPEQAAKDAHASHIAQKPGHAGGIFLYKEGNCVVNVTNGTVTGNYKSIDEAKSALFGNEAGDYSAKEVSTGLFLVTKTDDPYVHAVPKSQGVKNAIERAYQLTDIEWTTVADMPGLAKVDGKFTVIPYEPGVTYKGIPYSGTTATDTYVGMNISLESFLTALKNKNSVLYTENLFSTNSKAATYYGTVCSKFAQYALDIPGSYNSQNMHNIPSVKTIAKAGKYTVDQIALGDIVVNPTVHTTICTDILYDTDGNIAFVEISEATIPRVRRKLWTPDEFYSVFSGYRLCRYQDIADVPAAPNMLSGEETYALMPRFGDKYNYKVSTEKGIVDILESGYSKAVILRDGTKISEIALNETTETFSFDRTTPGKLEMYLEKADGTRSGSVYAYVVTSSVEATDTSKYHTGKLTISFDGSSGTPLYVEVKAQTVFCSLENAKDGQATIIIPMDAISLSSGKLRVAYQNEFGIYLSDWTKIKIE